MSETNPLLPQSEDLPDDPSIFLRVCHSPWVFISDRSLVIVRGLISCYLTAIFAADVDFEVIDAKRGKLFFFMMGTGSLSIQIAYYWVTFVSKIDYHLFPVVFCSRVVLDLSTLHGP